MYSYRRHWEKIKNGSMGLGDPLLESKNLVLLSYNILAQTLLEQHPNLYKMCPEQTLIWKNRFQLIMSEVTLIKPDIICFQEVQLSHLDEIKRSLRALGFETIYKKRTGDKPDGCAISYRTKLFNLVEFNYVEFFQPKEDVLKFDNIGLMVKFIYRGDRNSLFVVCTTHLLFNRKRTDARLAQIQVLLAELDKFSYNRKVSHHLPILLTGDFNSSPQSPVTRLVTLGQLTEKKYMKSLRNISITGMCQHLEVHLERNGETAKRKRSLLDHPEENSSEINPINVSDIVSVAKKETENLRATMCGAITLLSSITEINTDTSKEYNHLFKNSVIKHNFVFKSVYSHLKTDGRTEATVFQNEWKVVDYIYYCSNSVTGTLVLQEKYYLPTAEECYKARALPSFKYGSDHVSLAAKFTLYFKKLE